MSSLLLILAGAAHADAPRPGEAPAAPLVARTVVVQLAPAAFASVSPDALPNGATGLAAVDARLGAIGATRITPVFDLREHAEDKRAHGMDRIFSVVYERDLAPAAAADLLAGSEFEFVEPDHIHRKTVTWPDDPNRAEQWYHRNPVFPFNWTEDADGDSDIAWDYETGDPNLVLCILDSGIDAAHPEFAGRVVPGWDFVNNDSDPFDDDGHGTACAGIAAASGNDGIGIVGVVWDGKIMGVKVLDETGQGASTWVANGITWAADNGADVISMSLGSTSPSSVIQTAVNYAFNTRGAILFGASGNDNDPVVNWPAAFTNVMAVGSMSPCLERKSPSSCDGEGWWGSNYGTALDFLAPGVLMLTTDVLDDGGYTVGDYYDYFNGTSSATPYAAGAAALVWSYLPELTNVQLRELLRRSAEDMGPSGFDVETGYGHINPASAIQAHYFADATAGPLAGAAVSRGVAWADVDDDGDADLYVTNDGAPNRYLRNDGGTFVDATAGPLGDGGSGYGAVFGDADGDQDLDLYVANQGANLYLRNDGGTFVDATVPPLGDADAATTASWMDYDNDGDLDLYFLNDGTDNRIFENDGTGTFTDVTALPLGNRQAGHGLAWGDIDNDGDMDVYLTNYGAQNRLLRNDGGGIYTNITGSTGDQGLGNAACFADIDGDGFIDLFLANDGPNRLYRNNGDGSFSDILAGTSLAGNENTVGAAWADYDKDGDPDLVTTTVGGRNHLWRNEEGVSFSSIAALGPIADTGDGQGVAWADYDCDGDMDFYVANADGANVLVRNDDPGIRSWVTLQLEGDASDVRGTGARVRVVAGGLVQVRDVSAGGGFCSQDEAAAFFGLGSAAFIDTVVVTWPTGAVDVATEVPINQKVPFLEGQGVPTSTPEQGGVAAASLLEPNQPNPVRVRTTIRFRTEAAGPVDLAVYAVDGRRVRTLVRGERAAGEHEVVWDRRDAAGRTVASGMYYVQLESGARRAARTLLVLD